MRFNRSKAPLYLKDLSNERRRIIENEILKGFYGPNVMEALKKKKDIELGIIYYHYRPKPI
jgi:hypothetical protein